MKKLKRLTLLAIIAIALSGSANAAIIAGWDAWGNTTANSAQADTVETGFSATAVYRDTGTNNRFISGFTSNDGTFGTVPGASTSDSVAFLPRENDGNNLLTITLNNNSGTDYFIDSMHFDFEVRDNRGPDSFVVDYVSGGLGPDATEIGSVTDQASTGYSSGAYDYTDHDYTLSDTLTDTVLGNGESATFTIEFEPRGDHNHSAGFDNLAFQGTVVPEPASLALLMLVGGAGFILRRRFRR